MDHRTLLRRLAPDDASKIRLAAEWRVDRVTLYRWISGSRSIPGPVQVLIERAAESRPAEKPRKTKAKRES